MGPRSLFLVLLAACAGCTGCAGGAGGAGGAGRVDPPGVFGAAGSETRAIQVADAVMQKLGGTAAWKQTLYLTWNHAGRRRYLWDRSGGQVRLERAGPRSGRPYVIVFHVEGGEGRAWREGEEVTEASELEPMLEAARMEWIRDSWWLLLPYKLRDAGVSLRYQGEGQTEEGRAADVLEVTFADAAAAPASRCLVWVARESGMVEQWAGYSGHDSTEPAWTCRWKGWKRFGDIMLCGDRGQVGGQPLELTDIAVLDKVPARSFASPDPIDWDKDGPQ